MKKLEYVSVRSEADFLRAQAAGELNPDLSYEEYVQGRESLNELVKKQRAAMDPFDRAILEEREADFRRRRQPHAA
jgi:hypothetical protein